METFEVIKDNHILFSIFKYELNLTLAVALCG